MLVTSLLQYSYKEEMYTYSYDKKNDELALKKIIERGTVKGKKNITKTKCKALM